MQSLKKILSSQVERQKVGEVIARNVDGSYTVRIGTRELKLKNATNTTLNLGSQVVVARTDEGMFIVGESRYRSQKIVEIMTNG